MEDRKGDPWHIAIFHCTSGSSHFARPLTSRTKRITTPQKRYRRNCGTEENLSTTNSFHWDSKVTRCRNSEFQFYDPHSGPDSYRPIMDFAYHTSIRIVPRSLQEARNTPESEQWAKAHDAELDTLTKSKPSSGYTSP
eukprot:IDg22025t1